jgi:hypothetical protein
MNLFPLSTVHCPVHQRPAQHAGQQLPATLTFPTRAVLVVAGVPGAGKTTFIRRIFSDGTVRVLDSQDLHDRYRRWLRSTRGYPLYRPLVHLEHYLRIVAALLGSNPLVLHETGTRPWIRWAIARLARARGRTAHLLFLDVTPEAAVEGQRRRGRAVNPRIMARHHVRWTHLRRDLAAGNDPVTREGYASCIVCTREQSDLVRSITFV